MAVPEYTSVRRLARLALPVLALMALADTARAQDAASSYTAGQGLVTREELWASRMRAWGIDDPDPAPRRPTSRADSLAWERWKGIAERSTGRRIVISVFDRHLWYIDGTDTLVSTPAGVGMGIVKIRGQTWDHSTPRGRRVVLSKQENPVWNPPDWYYMQGNRKRPLVHLARGVGTTLSDGRKLVVRDSTVVMVYPGGAEEVIPAEKAMVYDGKVFVPPVGTVNRGIPEVLGRFKLDLGDGYMIHGTNESSSIGFPSTHGCIRLDEDPLVALYEQVEIGTPVYIY